jgi:hypothetical protein
MGSQYRNAHRGSEDPFHPRPVDEFAEYRRILEESVRKMVKVEVERRLRLDKSTLAYIFELPDGTLVCPSREATEEQWDACLDWKEPKAVSECCDKLEELILLLTTRASLERSRARGAELRRQGGSEVGGERGPETSSP